MTNYLTKSSKRAMDAGAGSSKPDGRCKKHPKHRQAPGVCSLCLRERLSHLKRASNSSYRTSTTAGSSGSSTSSSLSSYYSSSSGSSCSSPVHDSNIVLKKSRSVAFPMRTRGSCRGKEDDSSEKKNSGFWSKLLYPKSKRKKEDEIFTHSRTVRERESQIGFIDEAKQHLRI
ncbi:hypothetical protein UlMin_035135 [Ulmus minor]